MSSEANCLIIAGEKSGEEHALSFLPTIIQKSQNIKFWGVGGDEMKSLGVELLYHLKDFSAWGFSEVIFKIPFYFNALKKIEKEVETRNCRVAILIDFQDFNMRLAKRLSQKGVKILYYVAPQAWAWKPWRTKTLQKVTHTLFTIIPFEKKWFQDRGVERVINVPHPQFLHHQKKVSKIEPRPFAEIKKTARFILLPGSRNFEVRELLPVFMETISNIRKNGISIELGILPSPNVNSRLFRPYLSEFDKVFGADELDKALQWADFSLAASGTVTLTCALYSVPTVVSYRSSLLNEYLYFNFVSYDGYIALANLVHDDEVYPELIQNSATAYNIEKSIFRWLDSEDNYSDTVNRLAQTATILSGEKLDTGLYMSEVIKSVEF